MVNRGGVGAVLARGRAAMVLLCLAFGGFALLRQDFANQPHPGAPVTATAIRGASLSRLPLIFEPNQGQSDPQVKYQARGRGYGLYLTDMEAVLTVPTASQKGSQPGKMVAVKMNFAGANPQATPDGSERLPGHSNYLLGNDSSKWHRNIPQFSRVRYRDLYPGVDLDFYGKQGRLEYDFEVNPGADPSQIALQFAGAKNLQIAVNGDLVIGMDAGELRFEAPHVYQTSLTGTADVSGKFILRGDRAGFELGDYDHSRALVIDPVLTFSTFLGGSGSESCAAITGAQFVAQCPGVAIDAAGRLYIAGATNNIAGWPGTPDATLAGTPPDVFIARISSPGTTPALDYITFIGGEGTDYPTGVAVDSGFNVYVAGTTNSQKYPTANAFQPAPASTTVQNHAFLTKLDSSGSLNLYSTYISGTGIDTSSGLAVDSQGRAYVFGTTTSTDLKTTPGALQGSSKDTTSNQFFLAKIDSTTAGPNGLLYLTYIGGSNPANGVVMGGGIAVDSVFNVYLAGGTSFTDMPIVNAYQGALQAGGVNIWAARLRPTANNIQQYTPNFETYLGAPGDTSQVDVAYGVASDGTNTYVTGSTNSSSFASIIPSATTAFQATYGGGIDAFIAKFGPPTTTGTTQGTVPLAYFSYLGGGGQDVGLSIVTDTNSNARVTGLTASGSGFPGTPSIFGSPGGTDAFFARIVTTGTSTTNTSSTSLIGGAGIDIGTSLAVDSLLNSYIAGETSSSGFPVTANAVQGFSGTADAFVTELSPNTSGLSFTCTGSTCPSSNPTVNPSPVGVGNNVTFTYQIYNLGDPVTGAVFTDTLTPNSTIVSITGPGGSCSSTSTCSCSTGSTGTICTVGLGTVNSSTVTTSGSTTTVSSAGQITVTVTPTAPTAEGPSFFIGNGATVNVAGILKSSVPANATVNDFGIQATPSLQTVTAGAEATYTITVQPTGAIPSSVSLACGTGLPSGAACSFPNNPVPNLNSGTVTRVLDITTTARVTTPASLFHTGGPVYAFWLPISGLALIGSASRKRRWLMAALLALVLGTIAFLPACSKSSNSSITTGTPAGTYTVNINATSGATRSTAVQLVVQ